MAMTPAAAYQLAGCVLIPCAMAAESLRLLDASAGRFWAALAAVQVLSALGHAASSLPIWARWRDDTGTEVERLTARLTIVQGAVVSLLAGNIAYYGGLYYAGLAEIACFIAAAVAAYGGDKFLSPILARITGQAGAK